MYMTNSGTLAEVLVLSKLQWEVATPSSLDCEDGERKVVPLLSCISFPPSVVFLWRAQKFLE